MTRALAGLACMRALAGLACMGALALAPAPARAQTPDEGGATAEGPDGLAEPEPGRPNRRGMPRATPAPSRPDVGVAEAPWDGPRVELGYTYYAIVDGFGGGDVHAGVFGGYLPTGRVRLHGAMEAGARDYSIGQDDAILRGNLLVGYQHLVHGSRFLPYAGVVGTVGVLLGKRFHTPLTRGLFGGGLEVGVDLDLVRNLFVGVGLAWVRASIRGIGYDLFVLRLRIGL